MKLEAPARWLFASEQPLLPARRRPRLVEQVARALVALAELGAFQHAALQLELAEMLLDGIEVVVAEVLPHHREEASESLRAETLSTFVGDLPKLPEDGQIKPEYPYRPAEDPVGPRSTPKRANRLLAGERFDREPIEPPDHLAVLETIRQHVLAIPHLLGCGQTGEHRALGRLVQKHVITGHGIP